MVRSLDGALTTALNAKTRAPALTLTIEDHVQHYGLYQSPNTADGWNDMCLANDNSIVRVQVTRGGSGFVSNFQWQRITDPTQAGQWSSWTTFAGGSGNVYQDGGCAVSNTGGVLHTFAQQGTGGNALWNWYSTDNGQTWSGPGVVVTPPGGALIKGIGSAGHNDVFFLYDVVGGEALGCSLFSSSWSSLISWSLPPLAAGAGVAVVWNVPVGLYTIIYSDGYSLATCTFNPSGNVWSAGTSVAPGTSTAIGRLAPRVFLADGVYTLTCIEADNGALTGSVYSYPRLRQSVDLVHWSNGMILPDMTASYGAAFFKLPTPHSGNTGPRYYIASLPAVYSASVFQGTSPTQYLDVSAAVLSYKRIEQDGKPSRLEVLIDNAQGVCNNLVTIGNTYQPIGLNASMALSEGYKTGSLPTTPDVVKVGVYRLEQIHFMRSPEENHLLLVGMDLSRNLDVVSRYQDTYSNQTLGYLVAEVCARAGFFAPVLPGTSQMSQVIPTFVLQAGQSYRRSLDELCSAYGLSYFLDQNETLQFRELSGSDPSVWTYQPEIELVSFGSNDQRANHIIVSGKPPASGQAGALTTAEVYDDANLHLVGVERLLHHVDQKLTTTAQCQQKANFLLLQEVRAQALYAVTVPLNPALQLLDVITLIDSSAPVGSGRDVNCRVLRVLVRYDAQHGMDDLQLVLEGV